MILTHNMSDAKFVISKDELTYQEVLDDFPNASSIYVLTFNISKKQTELLDSLRQCSDDTDICIVSNLPDRWAKYFGAKYAEKAKKNISIYKTKLDPEKISKKAAVYFCFSNHAKIIMTDNIVYVGSSNFSEESADNFESGFISKDLEFIEFLQNDVFPWVIESSSEYKTDEEILFIKTAIRKSVAMFEAMREKYFLAFYSLSDHRGVERWYYNTTDCILSLKDLESTKEMFQKYLELLDRTNRIFNISAFVEQGFENLDSVMEDVARIEENVKAIFDSTIEDLARFDDRDYVDEYLQECPDAYDENLDHYIEKAMSSASNVFAELAEDCKEDADDLLEQLEDIGKVAKEVMKRFDKLPLKEIVIDNT